MADKKNIEKNKKSNSKEADNIKKIDIVEEAKKELKKLEKKSEMHSSPNQTPWGYIIGTGLLVAAGFILGAKILDMMKIQKLEAKLEEIVKPLAGGMEVEEIGKPKNVSGIYEFTIKFKEIPEAFTSSITGDGKLFFVESIKVDELLENYAAQESAEKPATCETINKTDSPILSVYVTSDCGHCKVAETAIISAIKQVPGLVDKIKIRYTQDSPENLTQVCLRDEQADAYWVYLGCMAEGGESATCLITAKANQANLTACLEDENKGKAAIIVDNNQANALQVNGTPSMYMNESQQVDEQSFGGRTADTFKQIICCGSTEQADYCAKTLE